MSTPEKEMHQELGAQAEVQNSSNVVRFQGEDYDVSALPPHLAELMVKYQEHMPTDVETPSRFPNRTDYYDYTDNYSDNIAKTVVRNVIWQVLSSGWGSNSVGIST